MVNVARLVIPDTTLEPNVVRDGSESKGVVFRLHDRGGNSFCIIFFFRFRSSPQRDFARPSTAKRTSSAVVRLKPTWTIVRDEYRIGFTGDGDLMVKRACDDQSERA